MEQEIISPEEAKAEQEALKEVKEDEVRANVISEFGFNETDDAERIEKLTAERVKTAKDLSTAIGQKIKQRTERQKLADELAKKLPPKDDKNQPEEIDKKVDSRVQEVLDKRDLEAMEYPDDLKEAISSLAKLKNITVKQAAKDPYIAFKVEEYKKQKEQDEATLSRNKGSIGKPGEVKPDTLTKGIDFSTPEGRTEYERRKKELYG